MTQRDRRICGEMLAVLRSAREGGLSLVAAADSLIQLRDALDHVPSQWAPAFENGILTMESAGVDVGGTVLPAGRSLDSNREVRSGNPGFVLEAFDELQLLLHQHLAIPE